MVSSRCILCYGEHRKYRLSAEDQGDTVSRNNKLPVKCSKLSIAIPLSGDATGAIVLSASLALLDSSWWHEPAGLCDNETSRGETLLSFAERRIRPCTRIQHPHRIQWL